MQLFEASTCQSEVSIFLKPPFLSDVSQLNVAIAEAGFAIHSGFANTRVLGLYSVFYNKQSDPGS